jgi:drug/metabolite transporter (DMT)-like permease
MRLPLIARHWPVAVVLFAGLAYSFTFVLNRYVGEAGIPFFAYVFWQALGGGLIVLVICAARRSLPPLDWRHVRTYLVFSLFGISYPFSILAFVAPKVPIGIIVIGLALIPTLTYGISLAIRTERFVWLRSLGILLALGGVLLMVVPDTSLPSPDMVGWVLLALTAPLSFTVVTVAGEILQPPESDSLATTAGTLITAGLCLIPLMAITGQWWVFDAPFDRADGAVALAILIIAFGWTAFFIVTRLRGAVFWTLSNYFDTLFGIGWGILLYDERHSTWIWAAAAAVLIGLLLVTKTGQSARRAQVT